MIICVAKNIFVSFAISPCFLSPCLPARFCELSNESNTQVDNELNTQVDKRIKHSGNDQVMLRMPGAGSGNAQAMLR